MSRILAINTASAACAIALSTAGGVVHNRQADGRRMAAARILPLINELLQVEGIKLADLDAIVVVTGPGSFTGMRIGVAVAQGLSLSAQLPVVPVSSLALTARQLALSIPDAAGDWLIGREAREDELYLGAYRLETNGLVHRLSQEWVGEPAPLAARLAELPRESWSLAGNVFIERKNLAPALEIQAERIVPEPGDANQALCLLGAERLVAGDVVHGEQLLPNYIKEQMDYVSA